MSEDFLDIVLYPDSRLREKCAEVTEFNGALEEQLQKMLATMHHADGVGLAGPQVGFMYRVFVADTSEDSSQPLLLVNPEIVEKRGKTSYEEGCLSIPGYREKVERAAEITVKAKNARGENLEFDADGILSICIQHEIDHLDGVLFIDHISRLKRELFRRWHKKQSQGAKF